MGLKEEWAVAKKVWESKGQPKLEPEVLAQMKKLGWEKGDFGKKLGSFDTAKSFEDKQKAWADAFTKAKEYSEIVGKAEKLTKATKPELKVLSHKLTSIIQSGAEAAKPPEPSGRAARVELVSAMNLASGVKSNWLQIGDLTVNAYLVIDAELAKLEKENELGFHWIEVQRECKTELVKAQTAFKKTIEDLNGKIVDLIEAAVKGKGKQKDVDDKVTEANAVLKYYAKVVEDVINGIADRYWKRALQRRAYLDSFKTECKTDVAMSGVAIAVSSVSIAFSFGAAALSALVIAKAVMDIAITLEKYSRDASAVRGPLEEAFEEIEFLYKQRLAAKKKGDGQKASKGGQALKTAVASALGPISERLLTTNTRTLKMAKEYTGKLTLEETEAGKLYKQLEKFASELPSSPVGPDASANGDMAKIFNNFKAMSQQYTSYTDALRGSIKYAENCIDICEKLENEDAIVTFTNNAGTGTKMVIAIASLAKLTVQLATKLI